MFSSDYQITFFIDYTLTDMMSLVLVWTTSSVEVCNTEALW